MALNYIIVFIVAVVAAAVHGTVVRDHRCQYTETKVDNCTRTVYTPCPAEVTTTTAMVDTSSSSSSSSSSSEEEYYDDDDDDFDDFISKLMRRFYQSPSSSIKWCRREETFKCVMYRCYIACCPGWKYNPVTRKCSTPANQGPELECQNGGSSVVGSDGEAKCLCTSMFTGSRCEEPKCSPDCQNDGMCDVVDGAPKCVCADDFAGGRCEIPICHGGCNGKGHCTAEEGRAVCKCIPEYTGRNCEIPVQPPRKKPGDCPALSSTSCTKTCQNDDHCPFTQKCCSNGCGFVCSYPANYTCPYKGYDHRIGDTFYPNACTVCTCLKPDPSKPYGGALCRTKSCPPIQNCKDVRKHDSSCCEYCADPVNVPEEYKEPMFINCPRTLVTVDVEKDRNLARLPFTLEAKDHRGNDLAVTSSARKFKAGLDEDNFDTVVATSSRDHRGNYAYCEFHVRIRDVHAPNFTYCPTDVHLREEGEARWRRPEVKDNVGLLRDIKSRYEPGHHFRKGEHPVVYIAEDFEGNIATCKFWVRVGHKEYLHGGHGREDDFLRENLKYILIGAGLLVLALIAVIVACCCRRRRRREAAERAAPPPAYDNALYNLPVPLAPPYKEKPPVYAETVPEKVENQYEEIKKDNVALDPDDVNVKVSGGIDNPMYKL